MLAVLRQRSFALLWFGGLISITGDWVLYVALPFYIYTRTQSTMATALMVAAEISPALFFGTMAGVFVDRWDRKRVLVVCSFLQAAVVLLLLLVPSPEWLWLVYITMFALSTVSLFFGLAENALLPSLVGREHLLPANSLNSLNNSLARLIGPAVGGLLLANFGIEIVILIDSATFLLAGLLIVFISNRPVQVEEASTVEAETEAPVGGLRRFWRDWVGGFILIRRDRVLLILFAVLVLTSFGGIMFDPLNAPWTIDVLGAGPDDRGWILTFGAIGGLAGSVVIGRLGSRVSPLLLFTIGSVVAGTLLLVQYHLASLLLTFGLAFVIGIASVASRVGANTIFQLAIPDGYLGRAFGALASVTSFLSLFSVLGLAGALGDIVGILPMLDIACGITILAGVVAWVTLSRIELSAAKRAEASV